jgi:D-apiose dehydrogenase
MKKLKAAIIGTGFWANFQVPAWLELEGVEIVALYNRTKAKAEAINQKFGLNATVYDDFDALLKHENLDFVDIITDVDTHPIFVEKAAKAGINVICQKPMAASLELAQKMLKTCQEAGVQYFIHENFRWQAPIRRVNELLKSGIIGEPFKGRASFCTAFPVFKNQPFLAELEQFIITDLGSHLLDICRFLFGEVNTLYCQTAQINEGIKGEDVATIFMKMQSGLQCFCEFSFASRFEKESFPQSLVLVEGSKGSIHLTNDFEIKITTESGTTTEFAKPKMYPWLDPDYAVVHSSIVDCNADILNGLRGGACETTGEDNMKTVELVFGCYESAANNTLWKAN